MTQRVASKLYDAVIIGGGPAGLTAALYLARARYRVVVVEKDRFGGQIAITEEIVNYPGVSNVSGAELTETMRQQAESFGAEFMLAEATGITTDDDGIKTVHTSRGDIECFGVLLAVGSAPRTIGFKGEDKYRGHGVAYCATCDGEFFTGKDIFVVGGGFAAAEESVYLAKYATKVHILFRKGDFSCAPAVADAARANPKIEICPYSVVEEVAGDALPRTLRYKNVQTGEETIYHAPEGDTFGLFVLAGYAPATKWLDGLIKLDANGNIETNDMQQTSVPGVFAAGDVCVKDLRQVVTATGEAATAAKHMEHLLHDMREKTGLVPPAPINHLEQQQSHERVSSDAAHHVPTSGFASGSQVATGAARSGSQVAAGAARSGSQAMPGSDASGAKTAVRVAGSGKVFDENMAAQLNTVFERMEQPIVLKLYLNDQAVSAELHEYANELAALTDKVSVEVEHAFDANAQGADIVADVAASERPCVKICRADGTPSGLAFHGVPGGHEFTSFVLGMYDVSGTGQPLSDADKKAAQAVKPAKISLLVSLSCTMCPETVVAAQRIASLNPGVTAEAYDINHFPALKDKYQVMSVPCTVINDGEEVVFGKKNIQQMLELLK